MLVMPVSRSNPFPYMLPRHIVRVWLGQDLGTAVARPVQLAGQDHFPNRVLRPYESHIVVLQHVQHCAVPCEKINELMISARILQYNIYIDR